MTLKKKRIVIVVLFLFIIVLISYIFLKPQSSKKNEIVSDAKNTEIDLKNNDELYVKESEVTEQVLVDNNMDDLSNEISNDIVENTGNKNQQNEDKSTSVVDTEKQEKYRKTKNSENTDEISSDNQFTGNKVNEGEDSEINSQTTGNVTEKTTEQKSSEINKTEKIITAENDDSNEKKRKLDTTEPIVYIEDVKAKSGDSGVKANIMVKNNPGILGMTITVYFDSDAVTLKQVKNGDAFDDVLTLTESNTLRSGCNFVWDGQTLQKEEIKDGTILELEFDIDKKTLSGTYPITVICEKEDVINVDLKTIELSVVNGSIKVE